MGYISNLHKGHRVRLKDRFMQEGLQGYEPHMVLELLLFYAVVQRDTNELGHKLLNTFGSFSAVVDAEVSELMKIGGITKNVATLIKLVPELSRYYLNDKINPKTLVSTPEELAKVVAPLFVSKKSECAYVVCMSSDYRLVGIEQISEGGIDFCFIKPINIVRAALKHNVTNISIVHNHMSQGGVLMPSMADITSTKAVIKALEPMEIRLFDHLIVAGEKYISLMRGQIPYL